MPIFKVVMPRLFSPSEQRLIDADPSCTFGGEGDARLRTVLVGGRSRPEEALDLVADLLSLPPDEREGLIAR